MERFWHLRRTHKKAWFGTWALVAVAVIAMAQWQFSNGNPILTQVLGAQAKKPDITPPTVSIRFPVGDGAYGQASWAGAVSGTASDSSGIAGVEVRLGAGDWVAANGTTSWSLPLSLPAPDGVYTLAVRATDKATPFANTSDAVTTTFRVDRQSPDAPLITGPEDPTFDTAARFILAPGNPALEAGETFECRLDGGSAVPCAFPFEYKKVGVGSHTFSVVGIDAARNRSQAALWSWTVLINKGFGLSGDAPLPVSPGRKSPVNLKISNPYNFAITLKTVDVTVKTVAPNACDAMNSFVKSPVKFTISTAVEIGANSSRTLASYGYDPLDPAAWPADWPVVTMGNNTGANQDVCKGATFTLSFSGTATKP